MKIKSDYQKLVLSYVNRLNDVRFVGQLVFVVIVLLISWSGIKSIQTNYELQKQISALKEQNSVQQLQNENLKLENDYYNTNQYLELSARQNFGLANTGEKEVIVPPSVALAHTVDLPTPSSEASQVNLPGYKQNLQSWINFFLHQSNPSD